MHTQTVNLPAGCLFNIYVEEIPHKTTVYEHLRTMIFFTAPADLRVTRDGDRVIVTGVAGDGVARGALLARVKNSMKACKFTGADAPRVVAYESTVACS